jgi:hypothetical protein
VPRSPLTCTHPLSPSAAPRFTIGPRRGRPSAPLGQGVCRQWSPRPHDLPPNTAPLCHTACLACQAHTPLVPTTASSTHAHAPVPRQPFCPRPLVCTSIKGQSLPLDHPVASHFCSLVSCAAATLLRLSPRAVANPPHRLPSSLHRPWSTTVSRSCSRTHRTPILFIGAPSHWSCTTAEISSSLSYHTGASSSSFLCGGVILRWSWSCNPPGAPSDLAINHHSCATPKSPVSRLSPPIFSLGANSSIKPCRTSAP